MFYQVLRIYKLIARARLQASVSLLDWSFLSAMILVRQLSKRQRMAQRQGFSDPDIFLNRKWQLQRTSPQVPNLIKNKQCWGTALKAWTRNVSEEFLRPHRHRPKREWGLSEWGFNPQGQKTTYSNVKIIQIRARCYRRLTAPTKPLGFTNLVEIINFWTKSGDQGQVTLFLSLSSPCDQD